MFLARTLNNMKKYSFAYFNLYAFENKMKQERKLHILHLLIFMFFDRRNVEVF